MSIWRRAGDGVVRFLTAGRRRRERRQAAWSAIADRRGGVFVPGEAKLFSWRSPVIDVPVGDAAVRVDLLVQRSGNVQVVYTRFRSTPVLGVGPKFKVAQNRAASRLVTALGFDDVSLGDAAFDEAYVVRTPDPEATREAWTASAKTALSRTGKQLYLVTGDGRSVLVWAYGTLESEEVLEAGIDVAADLASWGARHLDALRAIRGGTWVPSSGAWDKRTMPSVALRLRDHPVTVEPVVVELRVQARATTRATRELPPFTLEVDANGALSSDPPEGVLGPSAASILPRLGAARIEHEGGVVRVTPLGDPDPRILRDAAELSVHLALGDTSEGLFR